jgi:tetratricopeptide (TPR) repeat protein
METGHLHFAQGQFAQASTAYERAVALSNERFEAHLALARVALVNGQQAMAERLYAKAIQAAQGVDVPTQRLVHWRMGQYLLDAGHAQEATVSFSDALLWLKDVSKPAARNHVAEVQMDWACALMRLDHHERALQLFTSAATMASRENTLTRLAVLNQQHHFEEQALAVARRCVQLFPQSAGAHLNLAHVLMESGQLAAAEGVLTQAESLGAMPGAKDLRAALAAKLGDAPKPAP